MMPPPRPGGDRHPLDELPAGATLRSVTAAATEKAGRRALRVRLTDDIAEHGRPDVDYVDMPTFVIIPADFFVGTLEVDVLAQLTSTAPDYARAFAGLAYHLTDGGDRFEAVYLRPLNGLRADPPEPRQGRAVQYFAYPDWKYQRLRDSYPEGTFEAGADIGPGEWTHLRLIITETSLAVEVNGVRVLSITDLKAKATAGAVGLFVDIGTEAYFADLVITPG